MNEIFDRNSGLNTNKYIKLLALFYVFSIVFLLLQNSVEIMRNDIRLDNPLFDEGLRSEFNAPYTQNLIVCLAGLITILILKVLRLNVPAILTGLLTIGLLFIAY